MERANLNTFAPSHVSTAASDTMPAFGKGTRIVVVGAGCFGAWSALWLQRRGMQVTLIDAWGAGNSRSSSGDETRVIRSTYGANKTYFDLNVRALQLWREQEALFRKKVFYNTGVLWICYQSSTPLVDASIPFAEAAGMPYDFLTVDDLSNRYPLIATDNVDHAYFDRAGGYLKARESTLEVQRLFVQEGGNYIQESVLPPEKHTVNQTLQHVVLASGKEIAGDAFLFACGAWMGQLFPALLNQVISCSRQEVYYFGTPPGKGYEDLPVWVDVDGSDFYYGIPGNEGRGFKIGVDIRGPQFDPTWGDRQTDPEVLQKARRFLEYRFPGLRRAPLIESRVCPYENSPDGNFIFDQHPDARNIILLGGGSGHGFKHGPALGELVADVLSGTRARPSLFALSGR